jgi:hypothetical protein
LGRLFGELHKGQCGGFQAQDCIDKKLISPALG